MIDMSKFIKIQIFGTPEVQHLYIPLPRIRTFIIEESEVEIEYVDGKKQSFSLYTDVEGIKRQLLSADWS